MLIHGDNPKELTLSTIISIPKDSKSFLADTNNYRGSLFNSTGKLFNYIEISINILSIPYMKFGYETTLFVSYFAVLYASKI